MKIDKLIRILNNRIFFLILYVVLLALALIPYYSNGVVILGGEGDYVLDFSTHLSKYGFMWFPTHGVGLLNMVPSGNGLNIILLWLIENLTGSASITNFTLIFSIYFSPFFAMYLLCKELKATPFVSFLSSLFYVVNPFMLYYLINLNQWNVFSVTVMPLFLWLILKYYHNNSKLFVFFGIISMIFSFAYTNHPMLVIIHISVALSILIASYYYNKRFILTQIFKKYSILITSFILFNLWWILNLFWTINDAQKIYIRSFAKSWLSTTVTGHGAIIAKTLSLTTMIGKDPSYDFFTYWYSTIFAKLITLVPFLIIVFFVLIVKDRKTRNVLNHSILGMLLIVLFFVKGNAVPFGFIYDFMFSYVPFFNIFKTPVEKFGLLYVFIFSVLLLFVMNGFKNHKYYKYVTSIFLVYLIFCTIPIVAGNIIPDYKISNIGYASRKYKDKQEYKQFRKEVNNDNFQYRILSMPGLGNYQVLLPNYNKKYYTGLDPVLTNTNKPFIAAHDHIDLLYENVTLTNYKKLLGIYNIGKIVINEDSKPWFGTVGTGSIPELKMSFSKFMTSKSWGSLTLYENRDYFLPHIYVSDGSI